IVTRLCNCKPVWQVVSRERLPLRKQYLEAIAPPLVAVIRRWRPLLSKIYELTPDGSNPLDVDDPALDPEATLIENAFALITPGWACSAFCTRLLQFHAMIAAGAAESEAAPPTPTINVHLKRDSSTSLKRKSNKLHTFSSFQESLQASKKSSAANLKDKATARAAALAVAHYLERINKISSGRGLSDVAMATSSQRRSKHDMERVLRWNVSEAMGIAWMESFARNMQRSEVDRRARVDFIAQHRRCTGIHAWRKLIHYLIETDSLFGLLSKRFCNPKRV
ncbi:hypothetical protein Tco_1432928, partial [Tanacetum coccineum]